MATDEQEKGSFPYAGNPNDCHEFTLVDGKRVCRECARERARAWRQAKKVA